MAIEKNIQMQFLNKDREYQKLFPNVLNKENLDMWKITDKDDINYIIKLIGKSQTKKVKLIGKDGDAVNLVPYSREQESIKSFDFQNGELEKELVVICSGISYFFMIDGYFIEILPSIYDEDYIVDVTNRGYKMKGNGSYNKLSHYFKIAATDANVNKSYMYFNTGELATFKKGDIITFTYDISGGQYQVYKFSRYNSSLNWVSDIIQRELPSSGQTSNNIGYTYEVTQEDEDNGYTFGFSMHGQGKYGTITLTVKNLKINNVLFNLG